MFSGLLPGAKEKAVWLNRSGAHKGEEKDKMSPLSPILGVHFRLQLSSAAALHGLH